MLKSLPNPPRHRNRHNQRGISLIEMMVGFVVALVVLWGISVVYLNTAATGKTSNAVTQLNQDLRAVMDIMVADIRRAGAWVNASSGSNPFTAPGGNIAIVATDASTPEIGRCILYSYDVTFASGGVPGGPVQASDVFGFRIAGGVMQTLIPGSLTTTATAATDCANDAIWNDLSDSRAITMSMSLDTIGSRCVAFDRATYITTDPTTYTTWATTGGFGNACVATAPGAPSPYPVAPKTFVETRQVNITLTATSKTDATLTRTLSDTALVRNNRVFNSP